MVGDEQAWSPDAHVRLLAMSALGNWWARWQTGGREALLSRPRGRRVGEPQVLSEAEQAAVRQAVLDHTLAGLGLPASCGQGP